VDSGSQRLGRVLGLRPSVAASRPREGREDAPPVTIDPTPSTWTAQAESELRSLRDVEAASLTAEGEEITEVHVVTRSTRPAKQIVRDVQTLLRTRFGRSIDHRVVSVAYVERAATAEAAGLAAPAAAPESTRDRIRFGSVNVFVSGPRAHAQVELKWKGVPRMGSASDWSTRDGALRLVAVATLTAVQEFIDDEVALGSPDVRVMRMNGEQVAVVGVGLIAHRQEKLLVGSCTVDQDVQQAVVLATLGAVNRVVGGLQTREPIEYVLRPTSTMEASGAKRR